MRGIIIDPTSHVILNVIEVEEEIAATIPNCYLSLIGSTGDIYNPETGTVETPPDSEETKEAKRNTLKVQMYSIEQVFILNRGSRELQLAQLISTYTAEELILNSYYQKLLLQESAISILRTQLHSVT